ncbi:MAG: glycine betaine ABC transporter substrate-binding protein, partial [Steroidobacteraceae bacterium]
MSGSAPARRRDAGPHGLGIATQAGRHGALGRSLACRSLGRRSPGHSMLAAMALWAAGLAAIPLTCGAEAPAHTPAAPINAPAPTSSAAAPIVVGSKAFTESVILGQIVTDTLERAGIPAEHRRDLGGSRVLYDALRRGEIDVYAEYTGTLDQELLGRPQPGESRAQQLARLGLTIAARLGFEDTYVLGMRRSVARRLGITRISDLRAYPKLRFGFSNEFMSRADGWPGLERAYRLPQRNVRGLQHELAYRALEQGAIDVIDLYSTDPEIARYHLLVLQDDAHFFPDYSAILLARADLPAHARHVLAQLSGTISTAAMARMNAEVALDHRSVDTVASDFVNRLTGSTAAAHGPSRLQLFWQYTLQQLLLTGVSLAAAVLIGLPLGVFSARRPRLRRLVLGCAGAIETIPSLALLVFMIPLLGIGFEPAVLALFLYSLLPIIYNTCAGLLAIPTPTRESAIALGLSAGARLRLIELPLATRSILA